MKVIPFEQARPVDSAVTPRKDPPKPDVDSARQHTASPFAPFGPFGPFGDDTQTHDEPGYGHGV